MEITGTTCLVTGAGSGIGREIAIALSRAGAASVIVADIDLAGARATTEHITTSDEGHAQSVQCDLADIDAVHRLFAHARTASIVVNNAGMMTGAPWPDTEPERIAAATGVNLTAVMVGTRLAIANMRSSGGAIVNLASRGALSTNPFDPVYSALKAAVVNFSESCAQQVAPLGVRVNAVLPGIVDTPLLSRDAGPPAWLAPSLVGRTLVTPRAVADIVLDLVRDESRNGSCVVVDNPPEGTYTLRPWREIMTHGRDPRRDRT